MKVLHLSSADGGGGAGIAALRIHIALRDKIKSNLFVANKFSDFPDVHTYNSDLMKFYSYVKRGIGSKISKLQKSNNNILHSVSCLPSNLDKDINKSCYDLINLHWVQGEMISIEAIGRIRKPLVWTIHDTWPFCGSEHYPSDIYDRRYIKGYKKNNKPKGHSNFDFDRWCWERKKKHWNNKIHIVCPSKWLANCAMQSELMKNWDINVIPNTLDTSIFKQWPKDISRKLFNLPLNKKIILFGAIGGTKNYIKGWDLLFDVLKKVYSQNKDCVAVIFGESKSNMPINLDIPIYFTGKLFDKESLAMLYSSADVMVVPSRLEAFGQTASEASSCGTPVIAFSNSGLADIISHNQNGYLVDPYDTNQMSNFILSLLKNDEIVLNFKKESIKKAEKLWSFEAVSRQYIDLYKNILALKN